MHLNAHILSNIKIKSTILLVLTFILSICITAQVSASSLSDYPFNYDPGVLSPAPFSIQTFKGYETDRFGGLVCESHTYVVVHGDYAQSISPDLQSASFIVQKPATNIVGYNGEPRSPMAYNTGGQQETFFNVYGVRHDVRFATGSYGFEIGAYGAYDDSCEAGMNATQNLHEGYAANTKVWWYGTNTTPNPNFDWELTNADEMEVTFTNTSTDGGSGLGNLNYLWEFGDGQTSTSTNPVHRYSAPGPYNVKLTATNQAQDSASVTKTILEADLIVNSTGDAPSSNPELGCLTGEKIGNDNECTLRAAIEAAQAKGGGEISFDIAGAGVPNISVTSSFPAITTNTVIDATTQSAGQVQVTGPSTTGDTVALSATDGQLQVKGLAIRNFGTAITIEGGSNHIISNNVIGANPQGTSASQAPRIGVFVKSGNATIKDNLIVATSGVLVYPEATDVEISGNKIGVNENRTTELAGVKSGIAVLAPNTKVLDNTITGEVVGVLVAMADAKDVLVQGNLIGRNTSGTALGEIQYGVRVDGAPDATVLDNKIIASVVGVGSAGTVQLESDDEENISILPPDTPMVDLPVTGGNTKIVSNTIGSTLASADDYQYGIVAWEGANNTIVADNTVFGEAGNAIYINGGNEVKVTSNVIGVNNSGTKVKVGITLIDTVNAVVGGSGSTLNNVYAKTAGIRVQGSETQGTQILGNNIRFASDGISVNAQVDGVVTIDSNVIKNNKDGIKINGNGVVVTNNVVNTNTVGIATTGDDILIENNKIGVESNGTTVVGNEEDGITISGEVIVTKNTIAGNARFGVKTSQGAKATLSANKIYLNGAKAIDSANGPNTPVGLAAIRKTVGTSTRTTLLIDGLPEAGGAKIEVFADNDCSVDEGSQARYVLDLERTTKAGETTRVIQIKGNASRNSFTVTYTTADGHTSELSNCMEAKSDYPDSDGDGSVDPLDQIMGMDTDPSRAWVVTDNEELILVSARSFEMVDGNMEYGEATLENVAIIDDPAPGAHPSGWQLPYGVLQFRINVPVAGGRAVVILSNLADSPMPNAQYWKYGPQSTGATPSWYNFALDEETMTGATLITNNGPMGPRRSFALYFQDGARGDSDGAMNRTITDPGAIVLNADAVDNPTIPGVSNPGVLGESVIAGGTLPATGSNTHNSLFASMAILIVGIVLSKRSDKGVRLP